MVLNFVLSLPPLPHHSYARPAVLPRRSKSNFSRPIPRACLPSSPPSSSPPTTGWAACRTKFLALPGIIDPRQGEDFPGAHFDPPPPITGDDLVNIVRGNTEDEWINEILRTLLGWRQVGNDEWNDDCVEEKWKTVYTKGPPNFIGKKGSYEPKEDRPVKNAVANLTRSVPSRHKVYFKQIMRPLGFKGWLPKDLTPNLTRRAQAVNWIVYWYQTHYPNYEFTLADKKE